MNKKGTLAYVIKNRKYCNLTRPMVDNSTCNDTNDIRQSRKEGDPTTTKQMVIYDLASYTHTCNIFIQL